MPIRLYYDGPLLRMDMTGIVTKEDFFAVYEELDALEKTLAVIPDRIADLTAIQDSGIRFPELMAVAARRRERRFPNAFRTAIVAARPTDVGTARMFQTLNDHPQIAIRIFPDLAAAKGWLAQPPEPLRPAI